MASVYVCQVTGDGLTPETAYKPALDSPSWAVLMLDEVRGRAVVVSRSDTVSGTGIIRLVQATSWSALVTKARMASPTSAQRTALNTWLTSNGYAGMTSAQVTWWDCLHYAARQVNPAADLGFTSDEVL